MSDMPKLPDGVVSAEEFMDGAWTAALLDHAPMRATLVASLAARDSQFAAYLSIESQRVADLKHECGELRDQWATAEDRVAILTLRLREADAMWTKAHRLLARNESLKPPPPIILQGAEAASFRDTIAGAASQAAFLEQNAALRDLWSLHNGDIGEVQRRGSIERQTPAVVDRCLCDDTTALEEMLAKATRLGMSCGASLNAAGFKAPSVADCATIVALVMRRGTL